MDGLITLADLPTLPGSDKNPTSTIVVARLDDKLYDPRYGRFAITQSDVDGWKRNLSETFGGRVSIDFDHSSDRGNGTRAAAWITGLDQRGKEVTASVEWTPKGAKSVRNGDYRYISPTFVPNYVDEHKESHGKALIGAALTNRPVLRKGMPTLSLSKDTFDGVAVPSAQAKRERKRARAQARELAKVSAAVRKKTATLKGKGKPEFPMPDAEHARLALQFVKRSLKAGNITPADAEKIRARANAMLGKQSKTASLPAADSRAHMADRADLIKLLDLPADADSDQILAAACVTLADPGQGNAGAQAIADAAAQVKATKKAKKAAKKGKVKAMARDEDGNVILSAEQLSELQTNANAGLAAANQLATMRFETAWTKALSEGRAAPAQEETMRALFAKDEDLAVKTLDSFVRIVPVKPAGSGEGPTENAPKGMDPDRFQLHTEAKALARKKIEADPNLDEGEAYALAAVEIEERRFELANPGI